MNPGDIILKLCIVSPNEFSITIPEIASALDMSIAGIEKIIRALKKEGRLRRVGPAKGGHWDITEGGS